ncbi:hypothetical protein Tco_0568784 [Tanacetum coccineum]
MPKCPGSILPYHCPKFYKPKVSAPASEFSEGSSRELDAKLTEQRGTRRTIGRQFMYGAEGPICEVGLGRCKVARFDCGEVGSDTHVMGHSRRHSAQVIVWRQGVLERVAIQRVLTRSFRHGHVDISSSLKWQSYEHMYDLEQYRPHVALGETNSDDLESGWRGKARHSVDYLHPSVAHQVMTAGKLPSLRKKVAGSRAGIGPRSVHLSCAPSLLMGTPPKHQQPKRTAPGLSEVDYSSREDIRRQGPAIRPMHFAPRCVLLNSPHRPPRKDIRGATDLRRLSGKCQDSERRESLGRPLARNHARTQSDVDMLIGEGSRRAAGSQSNSRAVLEAARDRATGESARMQHNMKLYVPSRKCIRNRLSANSKVVRGDGSNKLESSGVIGENVLSSNDGLNPQNEFDFILEFCGNDVDLWSLEALEIWRPGLPWMFEMNEKKMV